MYIFWTIAFITFYSGFFPNFMDYEDFFVGNIP